MIEDLNNDKNNNLMNSYYLKTIEKLNKDYLDLFYSKEHKLGYDLLHFNLKVIIKYLRFIISRFNKQNKESFFYNKGETIDNKLKGVVYTCITNNYDGLKEPLFVADNIDYIVFSENNLSNQESKWLYKSLPKDLNNSNGNFANRYCKMNPFIFFNNYDYAIYIDGNVQIFSDISRLYGIAKNSKLGIAMHKHSCRNCIYEEAKICIREGKGNKNGILEQIRKYKTEGFPSKFGLLEATIIVIDLKNKKAKEILETWWSEFCNTNSKRDQLSLPYVIWKLGYNISDLGILGNNEYLNPMFRITPKHNI